MPPADAAPDVPADGSDAAVSAEKKHANSPEKSESEKDEEVKE